MYLEVESLAKTARKFPDQANQRHQVRYTFAVRVPLLHVCLWLTVWILLTYATRSFHPTLMIAAVATACLELGSAAALYSNEFILLPRFARKGHWLAYAAGLLLVLCATAFAVVLTIQFFYDILWGPDPRRLGLTANLASDFAWTTVHILLGAAVFRFFRRRSS